MSTISATQFFFNLGVVDGLTLEASTPIHKAWLAATGACATLKKDQFIKLPSI